MDWDKLKIFKAVADAGSFTHAEKVLNLSQSAISRQIGSLEQELGISLFYRHARGLNLTEQGEILLQTAHDVIDKLKQAEMQLKDYSDLPAGPLSLTTVGFVASNWLAPRLGDFKSLYPKIQLSVLLDDRVYDLNRREADAAIRLHKIDNSDLIEKYMTSIDFSLCCSKKYIEAHGKPKKKSDLRNHLMLGHTLNTPTPFTEPNWVFDELGIDISNNPNVVLINSMQTRHTVVRSGAGISVLPNYIIDADEDMVMLFPDLRIPSVDMFFIYSQEKRNSKRVAVLKEFLFDNINK